MTLISASLSEVLSLFRKWQEEKKGIRLIASLKSCSFSSECSVMSVTEDQRGTRVGLRLSGQPKGVCSITLDGCEFAFGAEDTPSPEIEAGINLDAGVSIIAPDAGSLWLLEVF